MSLTAVMRRMEVDAVPHGSARRFGIGPVNARTTPAKWPSRHWRTPWKGSGAAYRRGDALEKASPDDAGLGGLLLRCFWHLSYEEMWA